jgi:hypothetical protein
MFDTSEGTGGLLASDVFISTAKHFISYNLVNLMSSASLKKQ